MLAMEQVWAPAYTGLSTYLSCKSIQVNTPEHGRLYFFTCWLSSSSQHLWFFTRGESTSQKDNNHWSRKRGITQICGSQQKALPLLLPWPCFWTHCPCFWTHMWDAPTSPGQSEISFRSPFSPTDGRGCTQPQEGPLPRHSRQHHHTEPDLLPSQVFLVNIMLYPKKKAHTLHGGVMPLSVCVLYVMHLLITR